jgi:hypothetical protein
MPDILKVLGGMADICCIFNDAHGRDLRWLFSSKAAIRFGNERVFARNILQK